MLMAFPVPSEGGFSSGRGTIPVQETLSDSGYSQKKLDKQGEMAFALKKLKLKDFFAMFASNFFGFFYYPGTMSLTPARLRSWR